MTLMTINDNLTINHLNMSIIIPNILISNEYPPTYIYWISTNILISTPLTHNSYLPHIALAKWGLTTQDSRLDISFQVFGIWYLVFISSWLIFHYFLLLTSYSLLTTIYFLPLTSHCSLFIAHYPLPPTPRYQILNTRYQLLDTCYLTLDSIPLPHRSP